MEGRETRLLYLMKNRWFFSFVAVTLIRHSRGCDWYKRQILSAFVLIIFRPLLKDVLQWHCAVALGGLWSTVKHINGFMKLIDLLFASLTPSSSLRLLAGLSHVIQPQFLHSQCHWLIQSLPLLGKIRYYIFHWTSQTWHNSYFLFPGWTTIQETEITFF